MSTLATEINTDPLTRGYSGMTDAEVAASLNAADRTLNKTSISGDELLSETNSADYTALTDAKKNQWLTITGRSIDPYDATIVEIVKDIWGAGSTTLSNLSSFRTYTDSRAAELGLGEVTEGSVIKARAE